jgi:hypothetical protein
MGVSSLGKYQKTSKYLKVQFWTRTLGTMNIAPCVGKLYQNILPISRKAILTEKIGCAWNAMANTLHKEESSDYSIGSIKVIHKKHVSNHVSNKKAPTTVTL